MVTCETSQIGNVPSNNCPYGIKKRRFTIESDPHQPFYREETIFNNYQRLNSNLKEFVNFAGYLPSGLSKSSKIVELWLGLFSCLMRTAFGALLISYMTQTITTPPFRDLESLLDQTSYTILTLRGSLPNAILKVHTHRNVEYCSKIFC